MQARNLVPTAFAAAAALAVLAGCTSSPEPEPTETAGPTVAATSSAPASTASPTGSPSPTSTAEAPREPRVEAPADWSEASSEIVDQIAADPSVDEVVGVWTLSDGSVVSVVSTTNDSGSTDAEAYFASTFGSLGAEDGVEVSHEVTTTDAGDPLLMVDTVPAGGLGGDAQSMFYVLTSEVIVSGVVTTSVDAAADVSDQMHSLARSVTFE
ncbi:hypothetical protein [Demequina zhanjiangensis]|uniref:Lipoprotein n=1 Tax=Demequina zhanjiangensis TaxID=3051659 RepID=A0ABT8G4H1_9MICO|nr:hypothetical protein [Demequina sp. SYSU T00b26]MDN4474043.1 hypothetical protein [Demequina sp. SYSU T00b26]